jgi:hypothetical protein
MIGNDSGLEYFILIILVKSTGGGVGKKAD